MLLVQTLDRHFTVGAAQNGFACLRLEGHAGPDGLRMRRLHDQHEQSVACFGLARIGELHGRRHRRIVDRIEHILGLVRQIMQRSRVFLRVHAHRRGIEHDMNIARNVPAAEHGNACARNGIGQLLLQRFGLLEVASRDD